MGPSRLRGSISSSAEQDCTYPAHLPIGRPGVHARELPLLSTFRHTHRCLCTQMLHAHRRRCTQTEAACRQTLHTDTAHRQTPPHAHGHCCMKTDATCTQMPLHADRHRCTQTDAAACTRTPLHAHRYCCTLTDSTSPRCCPTQGRSHTVRHTSDCSRRKLGDTVGRHVLASLRVEGHGGDSVGVSGHESKA